MEWLALPRYIWHPSLSAFLVSHMQLHFLLSHFVIHWHAYFTEHMRRWAEPIRSGRSCHRRHKVPQRPPPAYQDWQWEGHGGARGGHHPDSHRPPLLQYGWHARDGETGQDSRTGQWTHTKLYKWRFIWKVLSHFECNVVWLKVLLYPHSLQATSQLVNALKSEAETQNDSEHQKKLLAAAKMLADATARMVEAAKVRYSQPHTCSGCLRQCVCGW